MQKEKTYSLILLITLGIIWGTGYSITRFVTLHGVSAINYSFWQTLGPAIILFCISVFINRKSNKQTPLYSKTQLINFRIVKFYLITGLTGIAIPNTIMYVVASHIPAGILAVIVNTVPIFTFPLAIILKLEKFNPSRLIGLSFAVLGLFFIIIQNNNLAILNNYNNWYLLALTTPLSFACCTIYISFFRPKNIDSISLSSRMLLVACILLFPLAIKSGSLYIPHITNNLIDFYIFLEIILASIGYVVFFKLLKIAGPVYYSLVDTTVALTGLTWGYFLFNEKLTKVTSFAICMILTGIFIITRLQEKVNSPNKTY